MVSPFSIQPLSATGSNRRRPKRRSLSAPMPLNVAEIQAAQANVQATRFAERTIKEAPPVPSRQAPTTVVPLDKEEKGEGNFFGGILKKAWELNAPLLPEGVEKIPFVGSTIRELSRPLDIALILGTAGFGGAAAAGLRASGGVAGKIAANFVEPIVGGSMARAVAVETAVAIAAGKAAEEGSERYGLAGGIIGGLAGGVLSAGIAGRALRPRTPKGATAVPNAAEIKEGVTVEDRLGFEIEEGEKQLFARPFTDDEILSGWDRTAKKMADPSAPTPRDYGPMTSAMRHVGGINKVLDPDDAIDREFMLLKAKEEQADGLIERMIAGFDVRFREGIFEFDKESGDLLVLNLAKEFNPTPEGQRKARAYARGPLDSIETTAPGPGGTIVIDANGNAIVQPGPREAFEESQERSFRYAQALAQEADDQAIDHPDFLGRIDTVFGPVEVLREGVPLTAAARRAQRHIPKLLSAVQANPDAQFSTITTLSAQEQKNIIDILGTGRRPSRGVGPKTVQEVYDELVAFIGTSEPPIQRATTARTPLTDPELARLNVDDPVVAPERTQFAGRRNKMQINDDLRKNQRDLNKKRSQLDRIAKRKGAYAKGKKDRTIKGNVTKARKFEAEIKALEVTRRELTSELRRAPIGAKHQRPAAGGRRRGNVNTAAIRNLAMRLEQAGTTKARVTPEALDVPVDPSFQVQEWYGRASGASRVRKYPSFSSDDAVHVRKLLSDDTIFEQGLLREDIVLRLRKLATTVDAGGDAVKWFPEEIIKEVIENDPAFFKTYVLKLPGMRPGRAGRAETRQRMLGPRATGPVRRRSRLSRKIGDTERRETPGEPEGESRYTEQRTGEGYVPGTGQQEIFEQPIRLAGDMPPRAEGEVVRPYEEDIITPADEGYGRGAPTGVRSMDKGAYGTGTGEKAYGAPIDPPDISPEGDYYSAFDWETKGIEKTQLSEVFETAFEGVDVKDSRAYSFGKGMTLLRLGDPGDQRYYNPKTGRVFTHEQASYIADFHVMIGQIGKYMESVGVEIHKIPLAEGAFYTPRAVLNLMREGFSIANTQAIAGQPRGLKESFQQARKYIDDEIYEAVANGINYQQNPTALLDGFLRGALRTARVKQLENNLVGSGLKSTSRGEIHGFRRAIKLVKAGRTLTPKTIERIYNVDETLANELTAASLGNKTRIIDKKTGEWREVNQTGAIKILPDGTEIPNPATLDDIRLKLNTLEESLKKFNDPLFEGQFFEEGDAKKLAAWLHGPGTTIRALGEVGDAARSLQASADFSAPFIQGLALLARDPIAWARGIKPMMQAWANPGQLSKYVFENEDFLREHPWLMVANPNEYFTGIGERGLLTRGFNKFDKNAENLLSRDLRIGKSITKTFRRFEHAFTFYGTYARVEMAKGLSPMAKSKVAEDNFRILTSLQKASETIVDVGTPLREGQPRLAGSSGVIDPADLDFIGKIDPEMAGKLRVAQESGDPVALRNAVMEAKFAAEKGQIRPAALIEMQDIVNKMTGVFSPGSFVLGPKQEHFERAFLFFAPRYTRASLAAAGMLFKSGIEGHIVRDTIMKMAGGGLLAYYLFAHALGQEPALDPRKGTFMTLDINGDRIGVGTVWTALTRLAAKTITDPAVLGAAGFFTTGSQQGLSETGGLSNSQLLFKTDNPGGVSLNKRLGDNQLIGFFRGRTSVISSNMWDLAAGSDFIGNDLETTPDIVKHLGSNALPFALEGFLLGKPQRAGTIATAGEFFGARSYPVSLYERRDHLRKSLAGQLYGKSWDDINKLQRHRIENGSKELEEITTKARKDRVLRGEVIDDKVHEWYDAREKVRETFDKTLLVGEEFLEIGKIDLYTFRREYFSLASRNRRAALEAIDEMARFEGVREWLEYQDQRPGRNPEAFEDIAYGKYLDTVILDELLTVNGTFDFRLQRQRIAEFKAGLPEEHRDEIYGYVLSRLEEGKDLPPLVRELVGGREEFKWYWGSADEVGSITYQVISARKDAAVATSIWIAWEEATSEDQYNMEQDKYTGPIIRNIKSMRDRVRRRVRQLHADLDIFLFRWGYTSKLEHPNNDFDGARKDARTTTPLDRYMLSAGDMSQQDVREGASFNPVAF